MQGWSLHDLEVCAERSRHRGGLRCIVRYDDMGEMAVALSPHLARSREGRGPPAENEWDEDFDHTAAVEPVGSMTPVAMSEDASFADHDPLLRGPEAGHARSSTDDNAAPLLSSCPSVDSSVASEPSFAAEWQSWELKRTDTNATTLAHPDAILGAAKVSTLVVGEYAQEEYSRKSPP